MSENETDLALEKKKKGRKPTTNNYFDEREETAVRSFLVAETQEEKNKIYNEFLKEPLDKMISSIIRRYKLYRRDMNFEEVHTDTHSFLMTKIDKFKPSKEKKAYSYFGTICKNYLMGQIMKDQKEMNRKSIINEDEKKLGSAIYDLFENYSLIFPDSNNNKFNKNIILFELREMTNLSTKEIRTSIKKFKKLYFDLVQEILKD